MGLGVLRGRSLCARDWSLMEEGMSEQRCGNCAHINDVTGDMGLCCAPLVNVPAWVAKASRLGIDVVRITGGVLCETWQPAPVMAVMPNAERTDEA